MFNNTSILVPPDLKEKQEFTVSIELWNALPPKDASMFLGFNRLFLMRYNTSYGKQISVVLRKYEDKTLVRL